jgi:hypothetical protein
MSMDIKATKLNLQLRADLLTAHGDFAKFEAKMRKLADKRMGEYLYECKAEIAKFQGGKWMDFQTEFDELEWGSNYGDSGAHDTPFMEQIARDLNTWILTDENLNLKNEK